MTVTTEDLFLGGALRLHQPASGYRAGLDAVLLAAACPAELGAAARVLDCGAGAGVVGLTVARRVADVTVTLVEREPLLAALAAGNAQANQLASRCRVLTADVTRPLAEVAGLAAETNSFDHVLANPPYHAHGVGTRSADAHKDGSHAMPADALEDWVRFAAAMAREGGSLTMIHRTGAVPEMLAALARRFGALTLLPLHPRGGEAASRVLIQGRKGSRAGLRILSGRVLHADSGHAFTPEFDGVLRGGAALVWR